MTTILFILSTLTNKLVSFMIKTTIFVQNEYNNNCSTSIEVFSYTKIKNVIITTKNM